MEAAASTAVKAASTAAAMPASAALSKCGDRRANKQNSNG
jgi:hypothetical protein